MLGGVSLGIFDAFKSKKRTIGDIEKSQLLRDAFAAFGAPNAGIHKKLLELAGSSLETAEQLYWFIPSTLFHLMFPEVTKASPKSYKVIYKDGADKDYLYSDNQLYAEILEYVKNIYSTISRESAISILSHSPEFHAVNSALNDRAGAKLEDLVVYTVFSSTRTTL